TAMVGFASTLNPSSVVLTAQTSAATLTTTAVNSDRPTGATYGQATRFTATVQAAGGGTPTGTGQFQVDGANVGVPVALSGGVAALSATLPVGQHSVTALYLSDGAQFADSDNTSTPFVQAVNPGTTTPAPDVALYFSQSGSTGGVRQLATDHTGSNLSLGAS